MKFTKKHLFPTLAFIAVLVALTMFLNKALTVGAPKYQDPSLPLPYHAEDVVFPNDEDGITLAGTLTLPRKEGLFPVVVLISGSGPQNRNEEVVGHRPFLVLADHLTRNGIGVLRYDDRGVGKSTGKFRMSKLDDFASDVESAIAYLRTRKEIDPHNIGLIGHSEGGIVAPMVASTSDDVSFIVLLAGPGIDPMVLLPLQQKMIAASGGATDAEAEYVRSASAELLQFVIDYPDPETFTEKLTEFTDVNWDKIRKLPVIPTGITKEKYISTMKTAMTAGWFRDILLIDPPGILQTVNCPVLALNGDKDVQVPSTENLAGIRNALAAGGNQNFTVKALPGLNHFFQECETGSMSEYKDIQQTFSPTALEEISGWVLAQINNPK